MLLPPNLDRAGLENCRQRVERLLNDLTCEAEAWAAAGTRKAGEVAISPTHGPAPASLEDTPTYADRVTPSRVA
jgi:hypothetical protein